MIEKIPLEDYKKRIMITSKKLLALHFDSMGKGDRFLIEDVGDKLVNMRISNEPVLVDFNNGYALTQMEYGKWMDGKFFPRRWRRSQILIFLSYSMMMFLNVMLSN